MTPNGEVHPAAAVFPVLADDELADLAADIAANGQRQPIVLLPDGTLLDGRNRLAACQLAGLEPTFTVYDGDDPASYVLSANVHRRHLTRGAAAMAVAQVARIRGEYASDLAERENVPQSSVAKAVVVLDHAPELADVVLAGGSLDDAYRTARQRKAEAATAVVRLKFLRAAAELVPELAGELADDVEAGRVPLLEAVHALHRHLAITLVYVWDQLQEGRPWPGATDALLALGRHPALGIDPAEVDELERILVGNG